MSVRLCDQFRINSEKNFRTFQRTRRSVRHVDKSKREQTDNDSSFDTICQSVPFENEQLSRLQKLEQLSSALKEAYASLPSNDPMRLRLLTVAHLHGAFVKLLQSLEHRDIWPKKQKN